MSGSPLGLFFGLSSETITFNDVSYLCLQGWILSGVGQLGMSSGLCLSGVIPLGSAAIHSFSNHIYRTLVCDENQKSPYWLGSPPNLSLGAQLEIVTTLSSCADDKPLSHSWSFAIIWFSAPVIGMVPVGCVTTHCLLSS